jgi:CHAD domain-containing protein
MTTTTAYAEHDKLGPLSPAADGTLRARVIRAATDALAAARAAELRSTVAPHEAVHEVRKSLRRLRALVDLVAGVLPVTERKDLARGLSHARRSLGPARDQEVARDLLRRAASAPELAAPVAAIIASADPDRPSTEAIAADVAHAVAEAGTHVDALIAALPDELRARRIARGLARTYARARRARKRAKRSDRAVHRWRRRSKELSYQLSVVDALPGTGELRAALGALDDQLSPIVDRLMAKDYVRLYGAAGAAEDTALLLAHVHDELIARKDEVRVASRDLFAMRPRKLRRRAADALIGDDAVHAPPTLD